MFSLYEYLIVNLVVVFFHLGFWSGNFFLIAPFPDRCLLSLLTKCCDPLQKLRVSVGTCETSLSPPVILYY